MSGPHVESHQTTTVQRDGAWWVFCYACQRDIEPFDAARAAAPPVEPLRDAAVAAGYPAGVLDSGSDAASPEPTPGLREADAEKLRTLATWFDRFDDWREDTGKIAPGLTDYREVQSDLRRIAAALAASPAPEPLRGRIAALRSSSASDDWNAGIHAALHVIDGTPWEVALEHAPSPEPTGLDAERLETLFLQIGGRLHESTWHIHEDDLPALAARLGEKP